MEYKQAKKFRYLENCFLVATSVTIYGIQQLLCNPLLSFNNKESKTNVKDMYTSISNNDNLDNTEKKALDNINLFINDYKDYIDIERACEKLEKFDIEYKKSNQNNTIFVAGEWDGSTNTIITYNFEKNEILNQNNTINHELLHLISQHKEYYPLVLTEGVTSTICYEYGLDSDAYSYERIITYMFCETVSSDKVIESYLKGDFSIIEDELYKIIPDKNLIKGLKLYMDKFYILKENLNQLLGVDLNEAEANKFDLCHSYQQDILDNISNILCKYYVTKTNNKVCDENKLKSIYNSDNFINDYSIKMSIYNIELKKEKLVIKEKYDYENDTNLKCYITNNTFSATTNYFNKRNEKDVCLSDNNNWSFSIDSNDGVLKSNIINEKKKTIEQIEKEINDIIINDSAKQYKKVR